MYSYLGAAFASVVAESFILVSYIYLSGRYFYYLPLHRIIIKPIVACFLMGFFVYIFHELNIVLLISIAICIYFSILFVIKDFSKDDISLIMSVFKKDKST